MKRKSKVRKNTLRSVYFRTVHRHSKVNRFIVTIVLLKFILQCHFQIKANSFTPFLNEFPIVFTSSAILFSGTNAEVYFKYTRKQDFQFTHANTHPGRACMVMQSRNRNYIMWVSDQLQLSNTIINFGCSHISYSRKIVYD